MLKKTKKVFILNVMKNTPFGLSAPPIPPRIQLPRVQSYIAATKEKDFASGKGYSPLRHHILFPEISVIDVFKGQKVINININRFYNIGVGYAVPCIRIY